MSVPGTDAPPCGERDEASVGATAALAEQRKSALLLDALEIAMQALREVDHAQQNGARWYTKGESGLYQHVRMWIRRGLEAGQGAIVLSTSDDQEA